MMMILSSSSLAPGEVARSAGGGLPRAAAPTRFAARSTLPANGEG